MTKKGYAAPASPPQGPETPIKAVYIAIGISTTGKKAVRTLIYTSNTIEGFNRQLRKVTKSKGVFPTDDSLLKMLYKNKKQ